MNDPIAPFDPDRPHSVPLLYLAGPYTNPDPIENSHNIMKAASYVAASKLAIPLVPHMNLVWHMVDPKEADFWYEYDLHLLARCDLLMRLPGESTGADNEVKVAKELGIPVFTEIDQALAFCVGFKG